MTHRSDNFLDLAITAWHWWINQQLLVAIIITSLGGLVVLNLWFGYTSNNPFITHAFYIARDRGYWQRRDMLVARRHLDSLWEPRCSSAVAILHTCQPLFIYLSRLQLPQYSGKKRKTKKPFTGSPSARSRGCMGLKPQHKPRTPKSAELSPPLMAHPRRRQALPLPPYWPWQLKGWLQMKFLSLKWTATWAPPFSGDLITPGCTQAKSSSDKYGQISELEATCPAFLWLCEYQWPCDFLLSHMITRCMHTCERMPRQGCGLWHLKSLTGRLQAIKKSWQIPKA